MDHTIKGAIFWDFFHKKYIFLTRKSLFFIFVVFVSDFLKKSILLKESILASKRKVIPSSFFKIFFFSKFKELKYKNFKSYKNDFYDSKQTKIVLDFFKKSLKKNL